MINGGNCLGIRSVPGRFDTLFIPRSKLSFPADEASPLALISQSGAFAVARASSLWTHSPRYVVSVGNQIDLTVGDYLEHLAADAEIEVFACYVEGFKPGDGTRFLAAARRITASGRVVVLYRAGRTAEGVEAAISHTAAVAGSYPLTTQLAAQAGVLVADTIDLFDDTARTLLAFDGRELPGGRLGAMSNAGFESVGIADRLGELCLADLSRATTGQLSKAVEERHLESIITVRNPFDCTPIFDDRAYCEAASAILDDDGVDLAVFGCVPLTPALQTLEPEHGEDLTADAALAQGMARLWARSAKPWVMVVDGGPHYDEFARRLAAAGIPVFRTIDRALATLSACYAWKSSYLQSTRDGATDDE